MSGARVLVTGASGFIGRGTLRRLADAGDEVHAMTRQSQLGGDPRIHMHAVDLHDRRATERLIAQVQPDRLLHLAWDVTPGQYTTSLENLRWVEATLSLMQAFVRAGGRRVVAAGTCAEYDWRYGLLSEVTTPLAPATLYAACKRSVCDIIDRLATQLDFSFAWGRVFFMYGPNEMPARLVPALIQAARNGKTMALRHPQQLRDYLHVDDVASAFVTLLHSELRGPINIASGDPLSLTGLAAAVGDAVGREVRLEHPAARVDDPYPVVFGDVARLRGELGWAPRYALADGLKETVAWWARHEKTVEA